MNICRQGLVWDPGLSYHAEACFVVPISFTPTEDGWDSIGVGFDHLARIWAIETGGPTITFVGGADSDDPERHAEAVAIIERLLETAAFGR